MAVPMTAGDAQAVLAIVGAFGAIVPGVTLIEAYTPRTKRICIALLIVCGLFVLPGLSRLWTIAILGA